MFYCVIFNGAATVDIWLATAALPPPFSISQNPAKDQALAALPPELWWPLFKPSGNCWCFSLAKFKCC
jgi:hypothetical protein